MRRILESAQYKLYAAILNPLSNFVATNPGTGLSGTVKSIMDRGINILPKDKRAKDVLRYLFSDAGSTGKLVQDFMNMSFSDVPLQIRPMYKDGRAKKVAFYNSQGKIAHQIKDLLLLDRDAKAGFWCNEVGAKVTLLDQLGTV